MEILKLKLILDVLSFKLLSFLSTTQHGFCRVRSTTSNLMILKSFINLSFCNILQIDVTQVLVRLLIRWTMNNYICINRMLMASLGTFWHTVRTRSKWIKVTFSFPKGSLHGPPRLFFNFIIDLSNSIRTTSATSPYIPRQYF